MNRINLNNVCIKYAKIFERKVKSVLRDKNKVASGNTLRSILAKAFNKENSSGFYLYANKTFEYIETGRKPGKPPRVSAILRWIQQKPVSIKYNLPKEKAARLISKAIGKDGIDPTDITEQALSKILPGLIKEASVAYIKDIEIAIKTGKKNVN